MLIQCWANVVDGGPALKQHWVKCIVYSGSLAAAKYRIKAMMVTVVTAGFYAALAQD